jgi:C-terminal processing protease CtpA/Prc
VSASTHDATVDLLRNGGDKIELTIMPSWAERVAVMDPRLGRLGLRIATGEDDYTYVTEVLKDGQAEESMIFKIGDRIVSINNEDTVGLDYEAVTELLTKSRDHEIMIGVEADKAEEQ